MGSHTIGEPGVPGQFTWNWTYAEFAFHMWRDWPAQNNGNISGTLASALTAKSPQIPFSFQVDIFVGVLYGSTFGVRPVLETSLCPLAQF